MKEIMLMGENMAESTENLTMSQDKIMEMTRDNDYWTMILFLLFLGDTQKKDEQWEQFEHELIYKNRFSSDNPIV